MRKIIVKGKCESIVFIKIFILEVLKLGTRPRDFSMQVFALFVQSGTASGPIWHGGTSALDLRRRESGDRSISSPYDTERAGVWRWRNQESRTM